MSIETPKSMSDYLVAQAATIKQVNPLGKEALLGLLEELEESVHDWICELNCEDLPGEEENDKFDSEE